jgi:hypothetical protein
VNSSHTSQARGVPISFVVHPKTKGQLKTTGLDSDSKSSHGETERISYKRIKDPEDERGDAQDKNEIISIQDETSDELNQYNNDTDSNNSNTDIEDTSAVENEASLNDENQ